MKKSDFYYELPEELIAQHPAEPRDSARMMKLDRKTGETQDMIFRDLGKLLVPGDMLVINDSKVLPARLYGRKNGDGAQSEVLLLKQLSNDRWDCVVKPGKRLKEGARIVFGDGILTGTVAEVTEDGDRIIDFTYPEGRTFFDILYEIGEMPLPHYIKEKMTDQDDYQTVYAREVGSAACPTAGLHFTEEMLSDLEKSGIEIERVTLHVGLGTFRPVKEDDITQHVMHSEWYSVPKTTADAINKAKEEGRRVIAVGTTSCRTLESVMKKHGAMVPCEETTDIFIYPGFRFECIDGLITNFHLPESTLIMLVSAFAGYEHTMAAYRHAVEERYRFFSFGDCMVIL
ncbi:MAG: tRNA preQ1(34) S-adenosylmethionine ribosyltransferase-isomerase QueA, partial [Oscillospiraceae bacterium]